MLTPDVLLWLAARGFTSLTALAMKAGVPPQSLYSARNGRGISDEHVARLAKAAKATPAEMRRVLKREARAS